MVRGLPHRALFDVLAVNAFHILKLIHKFKQLHNRTYDVEVMHE